MKLASPDFIAEVSSNHHRDLDRCLEFIDTAASIGCAGVKFQIFQIDKLFAPQVVNNSDAHRKRRAWELPLEFIPVLAQRSAELGIQFACTPFYIEAVAELNDYVDFFKIASYELPWTDLLVACSKTGKPLVLSTGMATIGEVRQAVNVMRTNGCQDLTLLHCVSGYPTPVSECNLAALETIRRDCDCATGWSDHSADPAVIYRAVHRWGADMIEFHLDLDSKGEEYAQGHCWLPHEIEPVIKAIKSGLDADGDGRKIPLPSEIADRDWRADPSDGLRPMKHRRNDFLIKR
ncbi:MAG: N-acetylneuraminate synthase family protein [Halothiobacillaceae bacterium]